MIRKMTGPSAMSATALAEESGVSQASLSRWLQLAGTVGDMSKRTAKDKSQGSGVSQRPQDWTFLEKLRVVVEAASLPDEELGAFLRREGVHEAQLNEWRVAAAEALDFSRSKERKATSAQTKRIRELERELRRKDKALAETAALLVLKKKAAAIWGDGDDDTESKSGK